MVNAFRKDLEEMKSRLKRDDFFKLRSAIYNEIELKDLNDKYICKLDRDLLMLYHVKVHTIATYKKPKMTKDKIKEIHSLLSEEMNLRGIYHEEGDLEV